MMKQLEESTRTKQGRPNLTESGLRPRHRAFIRNLISGKGINESGLAAGFGRRTGYDLMKKPAIRSELARQMEEAGVTDKYLAKKIKQGLNAKTVPQRDDGKRFDDQFVRKQWADIAIKVKGGYAPEKIETEHKIVQIVIDSNMLNALRDSRALSDKEIQKIEHMPMDVNDSEVIDVEEISGEEGIDGEGEVSPKDEGNGGTEQVVGREVGVGDEGKGEGKPEAVSPSETEDQEGRQAETTP